MKVWWNGLSSRERILVGAGAAIAAVLLAMQLLFVPLLDWRREAGLREEAAARAYQLVSRAAAFSFSAAGTSADQTTPVRNALTDVAARQQVGLTFVNAQADGSVSLQAGPASPEAVYGMFGELERRYAIKVVSADIARSPDNRALLQLQATLSR